MGVFNSVYVLSPVNKTAAHGVSSGAIVSEWRVDGPRETGSNCGPRYKCKARKHTARKSKKERHHHSENNQRIFALKKGKIAQLIDEELGFLRRSRLSRKDETYQFAIAMKLHGMEALRFSMERINGLWTLLYETRAGAIEPVSKLAVKLNCSILVVGDKRTMTRKLDRIESIMRHYECIGWSVE